MLNCEVSIYPVGSTKAFRGANGCTLMRMVNVAEIQKRKGQMLGKDQLQSCCRYPGI